MRHEAVRSLAVLAMLLLTGCQRDYAGALACDGPVASPAPSALYRGKSIGDLESLASAGDLAAARVLGERYEQGDGVAPDLQAAVRWYRRAAFIPPTTTFVAAPAVGGRAGFVVPVTASPARPGDSVAIADLGRMYATWHGVGEDERWAQQLQTCAVGGAQSSSVLVEPLDDALVASGGCNSCYACLAQEKVCKFRKEKPEKRNADLSQISKREDISFHFGSYDFEVPRDYLVGGTDNSRPNEPGFFSLELLVPDLSPAQPEDRHKTSNGGFGDKLHLTIHYLMNLPNTEETINRLLSLHNQSSNDYIMLGGDKLFHMINTASKLDLYGSSLSGVGRGATNG